MKTIFLKNELILLQIGTGGPRGKNIKWSSLSQEVKCQGA